MVPVKTAKRLARRALVLALVLPWTQVWEVPAGAESAARHPIVLGATNTFVGSKSGVSLVRVPSPATLSGSITANSDVSFRGRGRVVALVLSQVTDSDVTPFRVAATRWSACGRPRCSGTPAKEVVQVVKDPRARFFYKDIPLPAGDYHAYLVTDGAPVKAILRLHGLSGTTRITPQRSVAADTGRAPVLLADPTNHVYSAGATKRHRVDSLSFVAIDLEVSGVGAYGRCLYDDADYAPPPEPLPQYGPHCRQLARNATTVGHVTLLDHGNQPTLDPDRQWLVGWYSLPEGEWSHGLWWAWAGTVQRAEASTLWLPFVNP